MSASKKIIFRHQVFVGEHLMSALFNADHSGLEENEIEQLHWWEKDWTNEAIRHGGDYHLCQPDDREAHDFVKCDVCKMYTKCYLINVYLMKK